MDNDQPPSLETIGSDDGETERAVVVRELQAEDIPALRIVLESAIVNPVTRQVVQGEVEDTLDSLQLSLEPEASRS